jgi:2-C-methyl-D-erythritol 4-phosphate cytidylyltransferase
MHDAAVCWAVIPAAGTGTRMRNQTPKQYLHLGDRIVIEHTLARFICHPEIQGIVVAIDVQDRMWPSLVIESPKPLVTVPGGPERAHSVLNALRHLDSTAQTRDWVLVHDAARPCLTDHDLNQLLMVLENDPVGGILATPVRDTLKHGDADNRVDATVDRMALWHALPPQMFRLGVLRDALEDAISGSEIINDEAVAVERAGLRPRLIKGRSDNIKITYPEDLALAELILAMQSR